jgi:hypothetical protein
MAEALFEIVQKAQIASAVRTHPGPAVLTLNVPGDASKRHWIFTGLAPLRHGSERTLYRSCKPRLYEPSLVRSILNFRCLVGLH